MIDVLSENWNRIWRTGDMRFSDDIDALDARSPSRKSRQKLHDV